MSIRLRLIRSKVLIPQFFIYEITKLLIYQIFHIISLKSQLTGARPEYF